MISLANSFKIYIANAPVDFRKGMDGLAAIVVNEFDLDPFDGALFVFRSKRADRLKIIVWDGTGLVLVHKRIEGQGFVWPRISDGTISISKAQFEALFDGLNWKSISERMTFHPHQAHPTNMRENRNTPVQEHLVGARR
ncbi:MAG: IS66 family insertion sequence element accessory protein TnpB [Paracoccaceae bacterium]